MKRLGQDRGACNKSVNEVIDRFTVAGLVTWPLNGSKSGADLVLIQTTFIVQSSSYAK